MPHWQASYCRIRYGFDFTATVFEAATAIEASQKAAAKISIHHFFTGDSLPSIP